MEVTVKVNDRHKTVLCDICGKLMRSNNLRRHRMIHKDLLSLPDDVIKEELKVRHAIKKEKEIKKQRIEEKNGKERIYFDSFGQVVPTEIAKYLKTSKEFAENAPVIGRNTDIVQNVNTHVCGHLCLFVLTSLMHKHLSYQHVLDILDDGYTQDNC